MAHVVDVRNSGGEFVILGNLIVSGPAQATAFNTSSADVAERYHADAVYEVGTVVVIGGEHEITTSTHFGDTAVAGIISLNPALKMNTDAGPDDTHPFVALRGRVPCKVSGGVRKGGLLTTSDVPGYAAAIRTDTHPSAIIGKALSAFNGDLGVVEVLV